jgi:hypothetical protein
MLCIWLCLLLVDGCYVRLWPVTRTIPRRLVGQVCRVFFVVFIKQILPLALLLGRLLSHLLLEDKTVVLLGLKLCHFLRKSLFLGRLGLLNRVLWESRRRVLEFFLLHLQLKHLCILTLLLIPSFKFILIAHADHKALSTILQSLNFQLSITPGRMMTRHRGLPSLSIFGHLLFRRRQRWCPFEQDLIASCIN